jgi:hypothetical protein
MTVEEKVAIIAATTDNCPACVHQARGDCTITPCPVQHTCA